MCRLIRCALKPGVRGEYGMRVSSRPDGAVSHCVVGGAVRLLRERDGVVWSKWEGVGGRCHHESFLGTPMSTGSDYAQLTDRLSVGELFLSFSPPD